MLFLDMRLQCFLARKNPGCNAFSPVGSIDCNAQLQCSIAMLPESPQIDDLPLGASIPADLLICAPARGEGLRIVDLGVWRTRGG